jgi:hypothetical protein
MKINLDTRMLIDILFMIYVECGEDTLFSAELLLPLREAYESIHDTQKKLSKALLAFNYSTGLRFMRMFSYDYPAWRVDPLVQPYLGGLYG